jgi:hypothetical protein
MYARDMVNPGIRDWQTNNRLEQVFTKYITVIWIMRSEICEIDRTCQFTQVLTDMFGQPPPWGSWGSVAAQSCAKYQINVLHIN